MLVQATGLALKSVAILNDFVCQLYFGVLNNTKIIGRVLFLT